MPLFQPQYSTCIPAPDPQASPAKDAGRLTAYYDHSLHFSKFILSFSTPICTKSIWGGLTPTSSLVDHTDLPASNQPPQTIWFIPPHFKLQQYFSAITWVNIFMELGRIIVDTHFRLTSNKSTLQHSSQDLQWTGWCSLYSVPALIVEFNKQILVENNQFSSCWDAQLITISIFQSLIHINTFYPELQWAKETFLPSNTKSSHYPKKTKETDTKEQQTQSTEINAEISS